MNAAKAEKSDRDSIWGNPKCCEYPNLLSAGKPRTGEASTTIRMGGVGERQEPFSEVEGYLNRERQPLEGWRQISHLAFGRTRDSLLPMKYAERQGIKD